MARRPIKITDSVFARGRRCFRRTMIPFVFGIGKRGASRASAVAFLARRMAAARRQREFRFQTCPGSTPDELWPYPTRGPSRFVFLCSL
jgi:hypothetical protein